MKRKIKSGYILYLGGYLDEAIIAERGLPHRNFAGPNRIRRIAGALRTTGQRVLIISNAISMRVRWMGRFVHPARAGSADKTPVVFCTAIGLPVLGIFLEFLFLFTGIKAVMRRRQVEAVMLYNYSPAMLLAALWLRLWRRIPVILNLEDVMLPKLSDWLPGRQARPVKEFLYGMCMSLTLRISEKTIVPTQRFVSALPDAKPYLVISGCMPLNHDDPPQEEFRIGHLPLKLLYSGKIEFDDGGIHYLMRALTLLSQDDALSQAFQVHICGSGSKEQWTRKIMQELNNLDIFYHGFLSHEAYRQLLDQVDVCLSLQDPKGRYADYKTPSKVYEYLAYGKIVIVADVGDLAMLPSDIITLCHPLHEQTLYNQLMLIVKDWKHFSQQGKFAACYAREHFDYAIVGQQIRDFIFGLPGV